MVFISVSDLRDRLSECLERAKAGEEVVVTEDGRPVVEMRPVEPCDASEDELRERARLERLAAQGLIRLGKGRISREFFMREPVKLKHGSAVEAVLAEREESPY
jgi:prevent-host-death family protein